MDYTCFTKQKAKSKIRAEYTLWLAYLLINMLQYEDAVLPRFFSHDGAQLQNSSVQLGKCLGLGFQARFHIPVGDCTADMLIIYSLWD